MSEAINSEKTRRIIEETLRFNFTHCPRLLRAAGELFDESYKHEPGFVSETICVRVHQEGLQRLAKLFKEIKEYEDDRLLAFYKDYGEATELCGNSSKDQKYCGSVARKLFSLYEDLKQFEPTSEKTKKKRIYYLGEE